MEKYIVPRKGTLNIVNKLIFLNLIYKFKAISFKFPERFGGVVQGNMSHSLNYFPNMSTLLKVSISSLSADLPHFLSQGH